MDDEFKIMDHMVLFQFASNLKIRYDIVIVTPTAEYPFL